ncbi:hypothetical protein BGX26_003313, partial [Mortierella sp. AD094]
MSILSPSPLVLSSIFHSSSSTSLSSLSSPSTTTATQAFKSNFSLNSDLASSTKPYIIIVGGGIGGLMLAILLEHGQIPYTVLERSSHVRLLGSAIALGPGVLPLFEQLGMLKEIEQFSRPVTRGMVWSEKLVPIMDLDHTTTQKRYGYLTRIISRPKLYEILLSRVPSEKIHMGKKVVSYTQESLSPLQQQQQQQQQPETKNIVVSCEDGSLFTGDILVGADGAYSVTRQLMYQYKEEDYAAFIAAAKIASISLADDINNKKKKKKTSNSNSEDSNSDSDSDQDSDQDSDLKSNSNSNLEIPTATSCYSSCYTPLPDSDKEPLVFTSTCLVGQTRPGLDLKKFKYIRGPDCKIGSIVGDNKPYSWSIFSMPDDSICWMVTQHLGESYHVTPSGSSPSSPISDSPYHSSCPSASSSRSSSPSSKTSSTSKSKSKSKSKSSGNDSDSSSNSSSSNLGWGPDKVEMMCEQVKDFPIPCGPGLKLSDLIQETDQEKISK